MLTWRWGVRTSDIESPHRAPKAPERKAGAAAGTMPAFPPIGSPGLVRQSSGGRTRTYDTRIMIPLL